MGWEKKVLDKYIITPYFSPSACYVTQTHHLKMSQFETKLLKWGRAAAADVEPNGRVRLGSRGVTLTLQNLWWILPKVFALNMSENENDFDSPIAASSVTAEPTGWWVELGDGW